MSYAYTGDVGDVVVHVALYLSRPK